MINIPSSAPIPQSIPSFSPSLSITPKTEIKDSDQPITRKRKQTAITSIRSKKMTFDNAMKMRLEVLHPFVEATKAVSGGKYMTDSIIIVT